ncbi:RagB/SusD family nutrient uptake outer membrane protein [Salinimicrobium sp. MT39]|uniref:RagB/SusD family nutrient uptake outer membrane protein n=1 Tax=Salinimicrobium profundisediminis TaxID=2994553 RepID=A0A9X3I0F1_9FLAO|nr:RagB/SusD family nutrient uptake outer membrane protein [Salinimicrobium profundisediminis]MCX2837469.1 RagB/SusD family nutrient uptake outer membrane protein [Salinimicrobium profundisediminis]
MKQNHLFRIPSFVLLLLILISCEDFIEVEVPNNQLIQEVVFDSDDTAQSAMIGIYNQLFLAEFANGHFSSVTVLSGLSGDIIENHKNYPSRIQFEDHQLEPSNPENLYIWSSAYNVVYMTNSMLEGLLESKNLSPALKQQLEGEARFIRAFSYFYLANLYGDVPLLLTTDYNENRLASRDPVADVYLQIIEDLEISRELLSTDYRDGERTQVNTTAATALLARVHLYLENWEQAEALSTMIIETTMQYELLNDLDEVFLANSREAILQITPLGGGGYMTQTNEGFNFIIDPVIYFMAAFKLNNEFPEAFDKNDKRLLNWIGFHEGENAFFPYKYKIFTSNSFPITEYSMVLRLAEQYLIRAEARAKMGNLVGSIEDLDVIRDRAGLPLLAETDPGINQENLLDLIFEERRKELFAEWGHRWFDLKRSGRAEEVFGPEETWQSADLLYPIPEEERMKNPNLSQNPGY